MHPASTNIPQRMIHYHVLKLKIHKLNCRKKFLENPEGAGLLFKQETSRYYLSDPLFRLWTIRNL